MLKFLEKTVQSPTVQNAAKNVVRRVASQANQGHTTSTHALQEEAFIHGAGIGALATVTTGMMVAAFHNDRKNHEVSNVQPQGTVVAQDRSRNK